MLADLGFALEWDNVQAAPLPMLQASVKMWLERERPTCLIHPHGFFVVLLGRTSTEEWRLHFWPQGQRVVTGMPAFIHTHNCHIESRVLKGCISNVEYDVITAPIGGQPLYDVDYSGDRYAAETSNVLRNTGKRVQAIVRKRCALKCGDTYHVERYAYHEAVVSIQDATSTLVCMHGRTSGAVSVIGIDGYPETIAFRRDKSQALEFAEWFS